MKFCLIGLTLASLLASGATASELAIGEPLPELRGEFLTGRSVTLPQAAAGRVALVILGFTYDSRHQVENWTKKFRQQFGGDPQVTFYEVPMIGGFARLGKWFIDSGMRRGTPKEDHENVITVYGGTDPWKQRLGYRDPKAAYLILVDQGGKVVWRHAGPLDDQRFQSLSSEVSKLLSK